MRGRAQPRHEPPEHLAVQFVVVEPDQPVRRIVGVGDDAIVPDDEHTLLEGVENVLEHAALAGEALDELREVDRVERVEPPEHAIERGVLFAGHDESENGFPADGNGAAWQVVTRRTVAGPRSWRLRRTESVLSRRARCRGPVMTLDFQTFDL